MHASNRPWGEVMSLSKATQSVPLYASYGHEISHRSDTAILSELLGIAGNEPRIADRLLESYGSLSGIMAASSIEVRDFPGISADAARILQLVLELVNRMRLAPLEKRVCLGTTEAAKDFAMALLAGEGYEVFYVVCLDPQHGVLGVVKMSDGTPNSVVVQVRTVAESCFRQHASSAILLHNHPGGATTPSKGDVAMTRKIARALKYLSITLCDHLIVAHKTCVSFKELALI